ncbi:MAG: substrate-binding domain-containing protein [Verrucomicrobiota bacterium]
MKSFRRLSISEQTTAHLRERLRSGQWGGRLPGVLRLCDELQVSQTTLRAALHQLETEGLILPGGRCRSRTVVPDTTGATRGRALRVGILLHDARVGSQSRATPLIPSPTLLLVQHALQAAGHEVFFAAKSQVDLRHQVRQISRHLAATPADAWIVVSGSRDVLEWFATQPLPCIALYGRVGDLPLARTGPDKVPAYLAATRRLLELGHRRIVLIARSTRRLPTPGVVERAFLGELAAHGVVTGEYHLPDWEETPKGLHELLDRLFRSTPPTALIIGETARLIAAMQFLASRHLEVPGHVSLVVTDFDESLAWCYPGIAHMTWSPAPIVRRIVQWVAAVRHSRADCQTINYPASFVPGGSIGPARQELT